MKLIESLSTNVVIKVYYSYLISIHIKVLLIIVLVVVDVESEFGYSKRFDEMLHSSFRYKVVLNSDSKTFDGLGRISDKQVFLTEDQKWDDRPFSFKVYTPCRTVLVLALTGDIK